MGLNITAYSNLKSTGKCDLDWEPCDEAGHIRAYTHSSFPQSMRGLPAYIDFNDEFVQSNCFVTTTATEAYRFRAGSYSGYGMWRQMLQDTFNPDCESLKPFYELIWFSGCEGAIGPVAAADLFEDFLINNETAVHVDPNGYFYDKYQDWTQACLLAKQDGLIDFH